MHTMRWVSLDFCPAACALLLIFYFYRHQRGNNDFLTIQPPPPTPPPSPSRQATASSRPKEYDTRCVIHSLLACAHLPDAGCWWYWQYIIGTRCKRNIGVSERGYNQTHSFADSLGERKRWWWSRREFVIRNTFLVFLVSSTTLLFCG